MVKYMFNLLPFILTLIAGFSTLIGFLPVLIKVKNINKFICASLSFASGVMLCVSITDLIPESINMLRINFSSSLTIILCFLFILLGIILSIIIDYYLPSDLNSSDSMNNKLYKVGLFSMLAIILHNIPEGIATFVATSSSVKLGLSLTIAIAMHNIPEGISIAVPIYYSTKSKLKAFIYTLISSLSEPFGALIAYFFLLKFNNDILLGLLFSFIAGIMMQISLLELLPTSKKYNYKYITIIFFIIGCIFMLFKFLF